MSKLVVAVVLVASVAFAIRVWDADEWWHLATGRWIAENGRIPYTDPFSFVAGGQRWLAAPWLSDAIFYAAYAVGGFAGIAALKMAIGAATLGAASATAAERGLDAPYRAALVLTLAVVMQVRLGRVRAESLGVLMLAVGVYVASRADLRGGRNALLFVPVVFVWTFLHTSAVLGLVLVGIVFVGAALRHGRARLRSRAHGPASHAEHARQLHAVAYAALAVALCAASFALTTTGRDTLRAALFHNASASPLAFRMTAEWRRIGAGDTMVYLPALLTALGVAALAWRRGVAAFVPITAAVLGASLVAQAVRHYGVASVLAVPAWVACLAEVQALAQARASAALSCALPGALAVALPVLHLAIAPVDAMRAEIGVGSIEALFCGDTLRTLRTLPAGRVMNDYELGGYLIWHRVPGGVYWDGRNVTLYTEAQIRDVYLAVERGERALDAMADRYDIRYAIVRPSGIYGPRMVTSDAWIPLQYGEGTALFVRRSRAEGLPAEALLDDVRWAPFDAWMADHYDRVLARPGGEDALVRQLVRAHALPLASASAAVSPVLGEIDRFLVERHPAVYAKLRDSAKAAGVAVPE